LTGENPEIQMQTPPIKRHVFFDIKKPFMVFQKERMSAGTMKTVLRPTGVSDKIIPEDRVELPTMEGIDVSR
jgi:hypothetical protein